MFNGEHQTGPFFQCPPDLQSVLAPSKNKRPCSCVLTFTKNRTEPNWPNKYNPLTDLRGENQCGTHSYHLWDILSSRWVNRQLIRLAR